MRSYKSTIKLYLSLAKPGIIVGNLITAAAGFFLASKGHVDWLLFAAAMIGIAFGIGSACVFNNYIDRGIDSKMSRTKKRALVNGTISGRNALIYATILGILSVVILAKYTNWLTVFLGLLGGFFYLIMYGIYKRRSIYGTIVGSISGAIPPVAGYCAVTNRIDAAAIILFLILVVWQMPHFYAIAIFRSNDYSAASIPVLPVIKGVRETKVHILLYIAGFIIASSLLTVFKYTGYMYLFGAVVIGLYWLWMGIKGFKTLEDIKWARKMFGISLLVIMVMSFLIAIGGVIY